MHTLQHTSLTPITTFLLIQGFGAILWHLGVNSTKKTHQKNDCWQFPVHDSETKTKISSLFAVHVGLEAEKTFGRESAAWSEHTDARGSVPVISRTTPLASASQKRNLLPCWHALALSFIFSHYYAISSTVYYHILSVHVTDVSPIG